MADQSATFAVDLKDGTSGAAVSAAKALQTLRDQLQGDTRELAALQKAMKNLQGGTSVNIEQFRMLKSAIDAKKNAISQAQGGIIALGGNLTKTGRAGKDATSLFQSLTQSAKNIGGPIGGLVSRFGSLKSLLAGGVIALGIAAIAAGLVALVAATAAASAALLSYGISQSNARRSELLRLEGLTKLRSWYGFAAGNAGEMQAAIDSVSGATTLGRDKLLQYTEQLYKTGLRGQNLTDALEGTAIKAAVVGEGAANQFMGFASAVSFAGGKVRALTDDVKARFGAIATAQMLDLNVQAQKLRENFGRMFSGLKVEGLLKALHSVTELFSQSTASGRALKTMFEALFQPVVNQLEKLGPITKRFFQGMVIGALHITIALLMVRNWLVRTFGDSQILSGIDATKFALYAGVAAVALLAVALGVAFVAAAGLGVALATWLVPVLWGAAGALAAMAASGLAVAAPFLLAAATLGILLYAGYQFYKLWQEIDWPMLGNAIGKGIVSGLKRGAAAVKSAVVSLGADAMKAFKSALGIASPSKLFATAGLAIPQGVEAGIQRGQPRVDRALETMVSVPSIPATEMPPAGGVRAPSPSSASTSVSVGDIHIHTAATKAADIVKDIRLELERVLEGVAIQMGAPVPGGG